jgi:hypothetical protein
MAETDTSTSKTQASTEHVNAEKNFTPNDYEDYGYYLYHNRLNSVHHTPWYKRLLTFAGSRENMRKTQW